MVSIKVKSIGLMVLFIGTLSASAQSASTTEPAAVKKASCNTQVRSTYLLGPDDELQVSGPEMEDSANKSVRVDGEGDIQVPLVGRVHVAG
jgi:protein involved in polysaccharide export with SLBB domain